MTDTESASRHSAILRGPTDLPVKMCNYDRLLAALHDRDLTGIVISLRPNVFYMTGFDSPAAQGFHENDGTAAVIVSRDRPDQPILVAPDYDLAYFVAHPTWVEDIRTYGSYSRRTPAFPVIDQDTFHRFVHPDVFSTAWGKELRETYEEGFGAACQAAMTSLGIDSGRVAYDDIRFPRRVGIPENDPLDGYGVMVHAREVKTAAELDLLRHAVAINESATAHAIGQWEPGQDWADFTHNYQSEAIRLGGSIREPTAIVVANSAAGSPAFYMQNGTENFVLTPGMSIMLDCHGTWQNYCWDGGKTWVVQDERTGAARRVQDATSDAMAEIVAAAQPGVTLSELIDRGRQVFRRWQVPLADEALIFFHGLGLSHKDVEDVSSSFYTRPLEKNEVLAVHLHYPGDVENRYWLEDIVVIGGEKLYSWDLDPLLNTA